MGSKRKTQFSDPRNTPNPSAFPQSANPPRDAGRGEFDRVFGGGGGGSSGLMATHVPVIVPSGDEPGSDHPPVIDKKPLPPV